MNNFSTVLYNLLLENLKHPSNRFYFKKKNLYERIRNYLIKFLNDPHVKMEVHEKTLFMPLSHQLPLILSIYPYYDLLLNRLGNFIREKEGYLYCIDVGSNIGDSIAALKPQKSDLFLAIEAHDKFYNYLKLNWGKNPNVKMIKGVCSSKIEETNIGIAEKQGTAKITTNYSGISTLTLTIDTIHLNNMAFKKCNLIKTDTDGYDINVLNGAKKTIESNMPTIIYECDDFDNPHFIAENIEIMTFFRNVGYNKCILYDNFGYLKCLMELNNLVTFEDLLRYKKSSNFCYFDILIMKDPFISEFYSQEIEFFSTKKQHSKQ